MNFFKFAHPTWIERCAVELVDMEGTTEHRGYDLHIFASDDDPQSAHETSFTDEDNEQIMSVLMGITENTVRFDEVAKRETRPKGWLTVRERVQSLPKGRDPRNSTRPSSLLAVRRRPMRRALPRQSQY
ncbi:hypothetical protein IB276_05895 [Ensifer sp. ENS04]|uniref:hypothetical protein n=1 Tax=Ensifer sp. ENS04 TaxID=2769281 RepID=UPI0017871D97|nr:hypothetical protein [Ensifer sp. ENS04]MBD9538972.1 hypothetical protein [Ensifer sp. ENS04]